MNLLHNTLDGINTGDSYYAELAQVRQNNLTKPAGSLGELENVGIKLAKIQGSCPPKPISNPVVAIFAGDHGVLNESVSPWPQEVTAEMVYNFLNGTAAVNVIANTVGADVYVIDAGVALDINNTDNNPNFIVKKIGNSTKNIVQENAMDYDSAVVCLEEGIRVANTLIDRGYDLLATGDMGIGNTTPSAAIIACITDTNPHDATGRGTGIDDQMLTKKIEVIQSAITRAKSNNDLSDPINVLSALGGFEIGQIAGFILGAANRKTPVILDGVISLAGALIAFELCNTISEYSFAGHLSVEPGAAIALKRLNLSPLVNLNLRLGEGTGAALSIPIIKAAANILNDMATFESANISNKD